MNPAILKPFVRPFDSASPYTQEEPGDARFNLLLERDELPGLSMGRVRLKGPIHKTAAIHDEWDQAYVVLRGRGTVHLGSSRAEVNGPTVVAIPRGTLHSVEVAVGDELEYVFVNQYFTRDSFGKNRLAIKAGGSPS